MTPSREFAAVRDEIVRAVAPTLTGACFAARRGHRFIRAGGAGLVQVVDFPMARYTTRHYGTFNLGVGIYLPDAAEFYSQRPTPTPSSTDCEVRVPFGELGQVSGDAGWPLEAHTVPTVVADLKANLEDRVLPYFATYSSRRALCDAYLSGRNPGFPPRGTLTVAVLLAAEGESDAARQLVEQHLAKHSDARHREWVEEKLARSSLPLRD